MARIRFLWIQELPPNQTGQEETVNSHSHHLGRMPRDTPGQHEFPASPFSPTPHSSKARLSSLWKALDSLLTDFLRFPAERYRHSLFPSAFTYTVCCLWNGIYAGVTGWWEQQAHDILHGLEAVSWLSPCWQAVSSPGREPWHCCLLLSSCSSC